MAARRQENSKFKRIIGSQTVKKEIGTFAAVWNGYGVRQGLVTGPAPTAGLDYGKEKAKLPFQTREQIERQVARGGTLTGRRRGTLGRAVSDSTRGRGGVGHGTRTAFCPAYVYPMFSCRSHRFPAKRESSFAGFGLRPCNRRRPRFARKKTPAARRRTAAYRSLRGLRG